MTQQDTSKTQEVPDKMTTVDLTDDQIELICYAIRCAPVDDTTTSLDVLCLLGEEA